MYPITLYVFNLNRLLQVCDTIELMASNMRGTLISLVINTNLCQVNISLLNATNALIVTVLIPVLDLLVVPLLRYTLINPTIMKRLGFGSILVFGTVLTVFVIHSVGNVHSRLCIFHSVDSSLKMDVSVYWILAPVMILAISEVFVYIPGMVLIHSYVSNLHVVKASESCYLCSC